MSLPRLPGAGDWGEVSLVLGTAVKFSAGGDAGWNFHTQLRAAAARREAPRRRPPRRRPPAQSLPGGRPTRGWALGETREKVAQGSPGRP